MKLSHWCIVALIIGLFILVWYSVATLISFLLGPLELAVWHLCMSLVAVWAIAISTSVLREDIMILSTFLGYVYRVDAPVDGVRQGILGTHFVVNFPPPLAKGYKLPLSLLTIPFEVVESNTREALPENENDRSVHSGESLTPVRIVLNLQIRLSVNLEGLQYLVRYLPILKKGKDLTILEELTYATGINATTGELKKDTRKFPCMVKLLKEALQPTIDEAASRSIAGHTLSQALASKAEIEQEIRSHLVRTIFQDAHLISEKGEHGPACELFDINLGDIAPSNEEAVKALSAATRERYNAKGAIQKAFGESRSRRIAAKADADYLRHVAAQAKTPEGRFVLTSETLKNLPENTTLIATPNILDAVAAKIIQPPQEPKEPTQEGT